MDVKEKKMEESFKYHIPEDIPANERTAFHGAAAAAAKAGKKNFNFGGKTHPVTMKKDTANKIADQKESTMTFREKLLSLYEGDRKAHYKGATEPEGMHDKMKSSKGAMDMVNTPKEVAADGKKAADDNAAKSAEKKINKAKKRSGGDNIDKGDTKIVPGGTPVKEPSMAKENYGMFGKKVSDSLLKAISIVDNYTHEFDVDSEKNAHTMVKKAKAAGMKAKIHTMKGPGGGNPVVHLGHKDTNHMHKFIKKHYDDSYEKSDLNIHKM